MAYLEFKITKLPIRSTLYIESGVKAELDVVYAIAKQSTMYVVLNNKVASEPYDKFSYIIKPSASEPYQAEIDMVINISPTGTTTSCGSTTKNVTFQSKNDLTSLMLIPSTADRIKVTEIEYENMITVNGDPLIVDKTYMAYDWKNIYFVSPSPHSPGIPEHSIIHFKTGRASGWYSGTACTVTVNKDYKAYLTEVGRVGRSLTRDTEGVLVVKGVSTFYKQILVLGGKPNASITLKLTKTFPWAYAEFVDDTNTTEILEDETIITTTLDDTGALYAHLEGTPLLATGEENFGFNVELEILTVNGSHAFVDNEKDTILLSFYSHPDYAIDYNVIYKLKIRSSGDEFVTTTDISGPIDATTISSSEFDIYVDISMYSNKGVPPFTYSIEAEDGHTFPTTLDFSSIRFVNEIKIADFLATSGGQLYKFVVKVKDANNIISKEYFEINAILEATTPGDKPAITAPATLTTDTGDAIDVDITASNSPTSYRAVDLPPGLSLNTTTGNITGTIIDDDAGTYGVELYASNAQGESSLFNWSVVASVPSGTAPSIDSPVFIKGAVGAEVTYTIHATGDATITYSADFMPPTFGFHSPNQVIGIIDTGTSFRVNATNSSGTDTLDVQIIIL